MKKFYQIFVQKFLNGLVDRILFDSDKEKCISIIETWQFIPEASIVRIFQQLKGDVYLTGDYLMEYCQKLTEDNCGNGGNIQTLKNASYNTCQMFLYSENDIMKAICAATNEKLEFINHWLSTKISCLIQETLDSYSDSDSNDKGNFQILFKIKL